MGAVHLEIREGVAIITIDNPPMNVMSSDIGQQLDAVVQKIDGEASVVAMVVTGAGDRAFMAGADIKEFPERMAQGTAEQLALALDDVLTRLSQSRKPSIAAINGLALGGGCELSLACDFRIAEEHAVIGLPEVKLGVFPGAGGTQRLPRLIGVGRAKEMILTGEPVSAGDALKMGLVNRVVPKGQSVSAALEFAKVFLERSGDSIHLAKRAIDEGMNLPLEEGLKLEASLFGQVFQTQGAKEGVSAFIEKRPPNFRPR